MKKFNRHLHWENIYLTKKINEVSWYEPTPDTSLALLKEFNIPLSANIIDIGGGDSFLVDHLIDLGYRHVTVLDISETAIERAKARLGDRAGLVKWIVADAATFSPVEQYDFWHDRAAFHFLTEEAEIENYLTMVQRSLSPTGYLVIATFSENGPKKCSGIEVRQYSEQSMSDLLKRFFKKIKCYPVDHKTPLGLIQHFIFCSFQKLQPSYRQ